MANPSLRVDGLGSPAQVWARLAVEQRAWVIRLMVQLALNFVTAQADLSDKEVNNAVSAQRAQNPN